MRTDRMHGTSDPMARSTAVVTLLATLAALVTASGAAQGSWEFKVCAQPYDYPASSREQPGYENRIAEIIADELGAELVFEWTTFDAETFDQTLHAGTCDAVVGIGESVSGVMSTVPFLRAPYTFVTRAEDDLDITSLDDPLLTELVIGTYPTGVPSLALRNRGLQDDVREFAPVRSQEGFDRHAAILDALLAGEVDVAVVYGPAAAARAEAEPGLLRIAPVTPETDVGASILQMFRIWTIGVRPHDVVFRERLNAAMAARWDEIQAVIAEYGVHQLDIPRPPQASTDPPATRIGVVVPSETSRYHPLETVGEAGRLGAELAQNYVAREAERSNVPFEVLVASAPSDEAAVRAAERLAATEDVIALAGGFGRTQAEALARIAEDRDLVFFNIAANDDALRGEACSPAMFHIEASASMYADAAIAWYADQDLDDWYLVHEATEAGEMLAEHVRGALSIDPTAGSLVGSSAVEPDQFVYTTQVRAIHEASPDLVLVALEAEDLDLFYAQLSTRDFESVVTVIPDARAQTREFLYRYRQTTPAWAAAARPALWEATAAEGEAGDINDRYASRTGHPMEPTAWAAYAAVLFTFEAAAAGAADDARSLSDYLVHRQAASDADSGFDLGKGEDLSFREWDHQLRQPLYMVQVDPDASWGRNLSPRLALAQAAGVVPSTDGGADPGAALDHLGTGPDASRCEF